MLYPTLLQFIDKTRSGSFSFTLHEKLYLPNPGTSWKAQKYQAKIILPSTFWNENKDISIFESYQPWPDTPYKK